MGALAKVAGAMGGIHTSHMRDEAAGILDSVRETIRIGEEGGLPTQVTHHKILGRNNWGRSVETLRLVEEARARGVDVTIDQYPYTASSTGTGALFPQWSLESGPKALIERLGAPEQRARIVAGIAGHELGIARLAGFEGVVHHLDARRALEVGDGVGADVVAPVVDVEQVLLARRGMAGGEREQGQRPGQLPRARCGSRRRMPRPARHSRLAAGHGSWRSMQMATAVRCETPRGSRCTVPQGVPAV